MIGAKSVRMIGTNKTKVFGGQRVLAEKVIAEDKKSFVRSERTFFWKQFLFSKRLNTVTKYKAIEVLTKIGCF